MGESLAARMYAWRMAYHVSQERAARLADVSLRSWQRWERGETEPAPFNLDDLLITIKQPPPGWVR